MLWNILVIDQNSKMLNFFQQNWEGDRDYQITTCADSEFSSALLKYDWDLILLGSAAFLYEDNKICRQIRQTYSKEQLPIIILLEGGSPNDTKNWSIWCNDYFLAPLSKTSITEKLNIHLQLTKAIKIMASLNHIVNTLTFQDSGEQIIQVLETEFQTLKLTDRFLAMKGHQFLKVEETMAFQNLMNLSSKFLDSSDQNTRELLVFSFIENDPFIRTFLKKPIQGHFVFLRLTPLPFSIGLYRSSDHTPFCEMELTYLQNVIDYIKCSAGQINMFKHRFIQSVKSLYEPNVSIPGHHIIYICSAKPHCVARLETGEEKVFRVSLSFLEQFYENTLLRISKSHLVNWKKIVTLQRDTSSKYRGKNRPCRVILDAGTSKVTLDVGRSYFPVVKEHFERIC